MNPPPPPPPKNQNKTKAKNKTNIHKIQSKQKPRTLAQHISLTEGNTLGMNKAAMLDR